MFGQGGNIIWRIYIFRFFDIVFFWGAGDGRRGGGGYFASGLFSQILYNLVTFYGELLFVSFL